MSQTDAEPSSLDAWPTPPEDEGATSKSKGSGNGKGKGRGDGGGKRSARRSHDRTVTTSASPGISFREYLQYRELFHNLTLRELRSKYKRSVIGWGWSMINPIANMLIYTVVFSLLLQIKPPFGVPSGLHNYAIMLLAGMLPWNFFQGSIMESMGAILGNQNLIQKTYFPRELIPGATVASKVVSHLIEMSLLLVAVICFGNWRAPFFIPGVILTMAVVTAFALGPVAIVLDRQRVLPGHPALLQHFVLYLDVPDAGGLPLLHCGRRHQQPGRYRAAGQVHRPAGPLCVAR